MQNMAEITSVSISVTGKPVMICLTLLHWLDGLAELRSQIPIKRKAWQDKKWNQQAGSVFDSMRKPTEIL